MENITFILSAIAEFQDVINSKTKTGHDTLDVAVELLPVIESDDPETHLEKFREFLAKLINRPLTLLENMMMLTGLHKLVSSDAGTTERKQAMIYLLTLEFITYDQRYSRL